MGSKVGVVDFVFVANLLLISWTSVSKTTLKIFTLKPTSSCSYAVGPVFTKESFGPLFVSSILGRAVTQDQMPQVLSPSVVSRAHRAAEGGERACNFP